MKTIPTKSPVPYDYGEAVNEKLAALGWTAEQYDLFLDWMHQEKPIDNLVASLLLFAPIDWISSEADAIGIFEIEEKDHTQS